MPRILIGRTHDLYGKSLWELLCNLKDFGVGRVVARTKFNRRFPERSWFRVLKVEPQMDEENRRGTVWVKRVFRGVELPGEWRLCRTTPLTDYQLIPRHEEADFCQLSTAVIDNMKTLPARLPKPPLLLELERLTSSGDVAPDMAAMYKRNGFYRVEGDEDSPKDASAA